VHILSDHITSDDDPTVLLVDDDDAAVFLQSKTPEEYAPVQAHALAEKKTWEQGVLQEKLFNISRFYRMILAWLVVD
jgi:hypothetical protein